MRVRWLSSANGLDETTNMRWSQQFSVFHYSRIVKTNTFLFLLDKYEKAIIIEGNKNKRQSRRTSFAWSGIHGFWIFSIQPRLGIDSFRSATIPFSLTRYPRSITWLVHNWSASHVLFRPPTHPCFVTSTSVCRCVWQPCRKWAR